MSIISSLVEYIAQHRLLKMNKTTNKYLPIIAIVISTIAIASSLVFVKLSEVNATSTLMLRMFVAGSILSFLYDKKDKILPESLKRTKMMFFLLVLSGIISSIDLLSNHWAANLTSIANTTILMNTSPIFVALIAYLFFGEKISMGNVIILLITIFGASLLVLENWTLEVGWASRVGDLLAINSALFYAIYLVLVKSLRNYFSSKEIMIWNSFTCGLFLLPIVIISDSQMLPSSLFGYIIILLLAIISQIMGHGLMTYALKYVNVVFASISTMARPVVAIILGYLIFDESITLIQILGLIIVLGGIFLYKKMESKSH